MRTQTYLCPWFVSFDIFVRLKEVANLGGIFVNLDRSGKYTQGYFAGKSSLNILSWHYNVNPLRKLKCSSAVYLTKNKNVNVNTLG